MNVALEAEGLVKRYGARTAVQDLSFQVPAGSIYGVLGPNGAGKSTTLRMLVGVLRPNAGRISILGGPVSRDVMRPLADLKPRNVIRMAGLHGNRRRREMRTEAVKRGKRVALNCLISHSHKCVRSL